jgi:hypothetical protein
MADGEEEIEKEACVGSLCFLQPHPQYFPPPFYSKLIGRVRDLHFSSLSLWVNSEVENCYEFVFYVVSGGRPMQE